MGYYDLNSKPSGMVWTSDTDTVQMILTNETENVVMPANCVGMIFSTAGVVSKIYIKDQAQAGDDFGIYIWDVAGRPHRYELYIDPANPPLLEVYTPGTDIKINITRFYAV